MKYIIVKLAALTVIATLFIQAAVTNNKIMVLESKISALESDLYATKINYTTEKENGLKTILERQSNIENEVQKLKQSFSSWNAMWNELFGKRQQDYLRGRVK